jgi:hypothetical protein
MHFYQYTYAYAFDLIKQNMSSHNSGAVLLMLVKFYTGGPLSSVRPLCAIYKITSKCWIHEMKIKGQSQIERIRIVTLYIHYLTRFLGGVNLNV